MHRALKRILAAAALTAVSAACAHQAAAADDTKVPDNATLIAEVDGCRVWRVADMGAADTGQSYVKLEPKFVYFTKCGGAAVPTTQPSQAN